MTLEKFERTEKLQILEDSGSVRERENFLHWEKVTGEKCRAQTYSQDTVWFAAFNKLYNHTRQLQGSFTVKENS